MLVALLALMLILFVLGAVSVHGLLIAAVVLAVLYIVMGPARVVEGRRRWY